MSTPGPAPLHDDLQLEPARRWTRREYEQLVGQGFFEDDKIELLAGALIEMSPQGIRHVFAVRVLTRLLAPALAGRADLIPQCAFAAADDSEPEPDFVVAPISDDATVLPGEAFLVIEVSDSSLRKDRRVKARIYAAAGVPEYWIVNLVDGAFEVHRDPTGDRYATTATFTRGDSVRIEAFPDVVVDVVAVLGAPST